MSFCNAAFFDPVVAAAFPVVSSISASECDHTVKTEILKKIDHFFSFEFMHRGFLGVIVKYLD